SPPAPATLSREEGLLTTNCLSVPGGFRACSCQRASRVVPIAICLTQVRRTTNRSPILKGIAASRLSDKRGQLLISKHLCAFTYPALPVS
ncbi:MAG: hypothetical protein KA307_03290, partial [Burkholderiaceae bacterium]|nr:hypothetical protein [Burkholderiaceae bacterium]